MKIYNKKANTKNYILKEKFYINSKYIKKKRNYKFKNKFFKLFHILYLSKPKN